MGEILALIAYVFLLYISIRAFRLLLTLAGVKDKSPKIDVSLRQAPDFTLSIRRVKDLAPQKDNPVPPLPHVSRSSSN